MHMTTLPRSPLRVAFPLFVVGPPLLTFALIALSVPPPLAMTLVVVLLIATLVLLERRAPFRAAWNEAAPGETGTDVAYIAFASIPDRLTRMLVEATMIGLLGLGTATPILGSVIGAALLAFLVSDLGKYLIHRASHEQPWLWRCHLAHHQPARLTAWNALRLHPVNIAYNAAIDAVPLFLFGVTPTAAAVLATVRATVGVVQHANLDLEAGRQWLVNAPSYHRTHHEVRMDEAEDNSVGSPGEQTSTPAGNYASTLLVWDRLFGTLHRAPAPERVGVKETHRLPEGFFGQLLYPLCTDRLDTTCALARFRWLVR